MAEVIWKTTTHIFQTQFLLSVVAQELKSTITIFHIFKMFIQLMYGAIHIMVVEQLKKIENWKKNKKKPINT